MTQARNRNESEVEFRKNRRRLLVLVALFFPLLFTGFALNGWLHSELPLTLLMALFFVILLYLLQFGVSSPTTIGRANTLSIGCEDRLPTALQALASTMTVEKSPYHK
jgi:hypothetical protein